MFDISGDFGKTNYNNKISRKYEDSYGIPLISKSKDKERKSSGQKYRIYPESSITTKYNFNQTIHPISMNKTNNHYEIGSDFGF